MRTMEEAGQTWQNLAPADRERLEVIAQFAEEQLASLEARDSIPSWYHGFFEGDLGDRMFALGFDMDGWKSFRERYGFDAIDGPDRLEVSLRAIDDIDVLGAAVFSTWRYLSRSMSPLGEDDLRWLAIAFAHLKKLCGERLLECAKERRLQ